MHAFRSIRSFITIPKAGFDRNANQYFLSKGYRGVTDSRKKIKLVCFSEEFQVYRIRRRKWKACDKTR